MPADIARRDEAVAQWTTRFLEPVLKNPAIKVLITWNWQIATHGIARRPSRGSETSASRPAHCPLTTSSGKSQWPRRCAGRCKPLPTLRLSSFWQGFRNDVADNCPPKGGFQAKSLPSIA